MFDLLDYTVDHARFMLKKFGSEFFIQPTLQKKREI